jgi:hypothetical protein
MIKDSGGQVENFGNLMVNIHFSVEKVSIVVHLLL